jgi:predicted N-formylglutamate amidohydrolase
MARVILTVPHAACRSEDDKILHVCDVVAKRVAEKLHEALSAKGHAVILHIGDINRLEVDLNRPEGRETEFRKRLEKDFNKADFLLDCHSFPRRDGSWVEDIVLLKWNDDGLDNRFYVHHLADYLIKKDLNVSVMEAAKVNDIVKHSLENKLPAILSEFSEIAIADDEKRVVEKFAEAFDEFLSGIPSREEGEFAGVAENQVMDLGPEDPRNSVFAKLQADPDYQAISGRERNFIENFLMSVTGDSTVDGMNFQMDMKSYGFKNYNRLLKLYQTHYPSFAPAQKG